MKKQLLLLLLFGLFSHAQDSISISGLLLNNTRYANILVKQFGIGTKDIVAISIKTDGSFSINAPKELIPGVYRLQYGQKEPSDYVDVILDGKETEIHFTLDCNEPIENRLPEFTKSKENKNWYHYQKKRKILLQKILALQQVVASYPVTTDKIIQQVQEVITQEKKNYYNQEALFLKQSTQTWAGKMVINKPYYFTNPKDDWRLQTFEIKEHYWDKISTNNPELINTPLYSEHILEYLKYYMNPEMHFSEDEMNEGFIKSVDIIMNKFRSNEDTKKFAIQYLQMGFKEIGNEKVLQYIDEKYAIQEQCTSNDIGLEKRLQSYEVLKRGNLAPIIELTNNDGGVKTLSDFREEKVVIVFWASWCPHCILEMPKLQEWAKNAKNTLVLAISLDDDYTAFKKATAQYPNILHTCDLQKWNGKIASDYYIVATPTFIVLDKERKLVGKYSSFTNLIASENNN